MKKAYCISALSILLFLFLAGPASADLQTGCSLSADEATRIDTARSILTVNKSNYDNVINYWDDNVIYKDPVFTNKSRVEMYEYLQAMYGETIFGFPSDKVLEIKDELYNTDSEGKMTYIAAVEWSGTFGLDYYFQTGMSIIEFQPNHGCASYHRDYYSEGDVWYNINASYDDIVYHDFIDQFRRIYISLFDLNGRCFDEDRDGYPKYKNSRGCAERALDCNDFVAEINPGATEIPENGIDDDCSPFTPDSCFISTISF